MSTIKVNTIQSNTTATLDVNSPIPSLDVTGSVTVGGDISASGIVTATTFSGDLTGNVNSTGVTTVTTLSATNIVGVSTLGVTTAYVNTLSGISTIDASAAVSINQNLVFASGKGIDFSATANSSGTMTSELLSDYEEGTWTPTMAFATSYGTRSGKYVKVGKTVHVWFEIQVTAFSTGTASTWIQSEPFVIDRVTGCWAAVINGVSTTVDWRIGPWTASAAGLGVWMAGGQGSVSSTGITMTASSFDNYSSLTGSLGTSFTMRGGWTYISTT